MLNNTELFKESALVIVGHGSTQNPDSSEPSLKLVEEIRTRSLFAEVTACFWKEEPSMREVIHMVAAPSIFVVPNFISEGYFTKTVIPRELELDGPLTHKNGRVIRYCAPTGNHVLMTDLLLKRALEVAPGVDRSQASLLIVGHGTNLNDNSAVAAKHQARVIADRGIFGEVLNTYMEEDPLISNWDKLTRFPSVIVVPFFISDGLHSYEDIPVLLGISEESPGAASANTVFRRNPYHLRSRTLYYARAIGTEPGFADIIIDQARAFSTEEQAVMAN